MPMAHMIAKSAGGFLFTIFLTSAIISFALANLTEYSNLSGPVTDLFASTMTVQSPSNETGQTAVLENLKSECASTTSPTITRSMDKANLTLNCSDVNAADETTVFKLFAEKFVEQIYNTEYNCSYIECLESNMTFEEKAMLAFISSKAHDFYSSIILYLLIGAVAGGVIMAWGAGSMINVLKAFGWSFAVIGVGYFFIQPIGTMIPMPAGTQAAMASLINPLLSIMSQYLFYSMVVGVVLMAFGYGLGFVKRAK